MNYGSWIQCLSKVPKIGMLVLCQYYEAAAARFVIMVSIKNSSTAKSQSSEKR